MATLSTGNVVTVWQSDGQGEAGGKNGIYGQIHDALGNAVGTEFAITAAGNGIDDVAPSVAALSGGRFVVAYATTPGGNGLDIGYRIVAAEHVPDAKKLLRLTLSLGGEEKRNVFAGIKSAYKPEELVGRLVICVANLQPRQMKFGLSEGMVTAAGGGGPEGKEIFLLSPDSGAKPGQRVH